LRNNSTQKRLLQGPPELGAGATQMKPSVGQQITQANVQPVLQNLLSGSTGLGTSATKIGLLLGKKD
jgi:germacradienol/geosmin synthase